MVYNWLEKIHMQPTLGLSSGDGVYYRDHSVKGWGRWRPGVKLAQKEDYTYPDGIRPANGFDIYDIGNATYVSRLHLNIKTYKLTNA